MMMMKRRRWRRRKTEKTRRTRMLMQSAKMMVTRIHVDPLDACCNGNKVEISIVNGR